MAILANNYPQIEAHYPTVDIIRCTSRRALNLTEAWLMTVINEDQWNNEYKEILTANFEEAERLEQQMQLWGDPDDDGRGSFSLVRNEEKAPPSNFNFSAAKPE